jgi:arylformamidase
MLDCGMLYRGMDKAALDAAYNIAAAAGVERRDRMIADWTARTAALAAKLDARRDLRYGDGPRQRLDFYPCGRDSAPTLVFIHGGYWQFSDKENYGFLAAGPIARGINVALVEYTLAPAAGIDDMVAETRRALGFLRSGLAPRIILAGHSAGGHLAAMTMDAAGVAGVLPLSGLFDLEPIRLSYINDKIGMDEDAARRNSPLLRIPAASPPIVIAWGANELPELRRQSSDYCNALEAAGRDARRLVLDGHDHFTLLEELASPEGRLAAAARELAAR